MKRELSTSRTTSSAEHLDPMGRPEQPKPWHLQDPWELIDPCADRDEPEPPGIPIVLGPASRSGSPAPDLSIVPAPGIDTGTSLLASRLNWNI